MKLKHMILTMAAATILAGPALAEPSLADQKLQAEIDAIKLKAELDRQGALRGSFGVLRGMTSGSATVTTPEATAESLLLKRRLYSAAASQLAQGTGFPQGTAPLVLFGTAPPSVADWIAFRELTKRLERNLALAAGDWGKVVDSERTAAAPAGRPSMLASPMTLPLPAIGLGLEAVSSIAGLFKVDTTIAGASLAFDDTQLDAVLAQELVNNGFKIEPFPLAIADEPTRIEAELARLRPAYLAAHSLYHNRYLPRLAKVKKVEELSPGIALAGKQLEVVVGDFETLQSNLYTPANGILPATVLEWQAKLADDRGRPVIYIRNHNAALTTTTQKSVITSLSRKVPTFVNAAAEIDYILMNGTKIVPASIFCTAPRVRLTAVAAIQTRCERTLPPPAQMAGSPARAGDPQGSQ